MAIRRDALHASEPGSERAEVRFSRLWRWVIGATLVASGVTSFAQITAASSPAPDIAPSKAAGGSYANVDRIGTRRFDEAMEGSWFVYEPVLEAMLASAAETDEPIQARAVWIQATPDRIAALQQNHAMTYTVRRRGAQLEVRPVHAETPLEWNREASADPWVKVAHGHGATLVVAESAARDAATAAALGVAVERELLGGASLVSPAIASVITDAALARYPSLQRQLIETELSE